LRTFNQELEAKYSSLNVELEDTKTRLNSYIAKEASKRIPIRQGAVKEAIQRERQLVQETKDLEKLKEELKNAKQMKDRIKHMYKHSTVIERQYLSYTVLFQKLKQEIPKKVKVNGHEIHNPNKEQLVDAMDRIATCLLKKRKTNINQNTSKVEEM